MPLRPSHPRTAGSVPLAATVIVFVVAGIVLLLALTRTPTPTVEPPPAAVERPPPEPSRRVPIPERREPERDLDAEALALLEHARALARGDASRREEALAAYATAEDALRARVDAATVARDDGARGIAEPPYQQCIAESDAIAYAVYDDARVESTAWRDLLADDEVRGAHDGLHGFSRGPSEILAIGPPTGAMHDGIFSIGDLERWRDFQIEVEYAPIRGEALLYFRLGRDVHHAPDEIEARSLGEGTELDPAEPRTLTATYVGSRRRFTWSANTGLAPDELDGIGWRKSRVVAFGSVLRRGAELRVTKLRVRVLRAGP